MYPEVENINIHIPVVIIITAFDNSMLFNMPNDFPCMVPEILYSNIKYFYYKIFMMVLNNNNDLYPVPIFHFTLSLSQGHSDPITTSKFKSIYNNFNLLFGAVVFFQFYLHTKVVFYKYSKFLFNYIRG